MIKYKTDLRALSGAREIFIEGSSPELLNELVEYIEKRKSGVQKIYIALFLFNNRNLHRKLVEWSSQGIEVTVFSIPLEGYDKTPKRLCQYEDAKDGQIEKASKRNMASEIYQEINASGNDNYSLVQVPDVYIRSKEMAQKFARGDGGLPYILHIKTLVIQYKNDSGAIVSTSSNLAAGDEQMIETMVIVEDDKAYLQPALKFFNDLKEWFDKKTIKISTLNYNNDYVAPFYKDSQDNVEVYLKNLINKAEKRIYVCAQHVSAYKYDIWNYYKTRKYSSPPSEEREGILAAVLEKSKSNSNIDITVAMQTFLKDDALILRNFNGDILKDRRTMNSGEKDLHKFVDALRNYPRVNLFVNPQLHSKFIVIDDTAVITTCNLTPTQFTYLQHVEIKDDSKEKNFLYKGIFSEIGQFITIKNADVVDKIASDFNTIVSKSYYFKQCPSCGNQMRSTQPQFYRCPDCKRCILIKKYNKKTP